MTHNLIVFICSTFIDLAEERELVLDAVRRLHLQHDAMEFFGARSNRPLETCLAEVRRSDLLAVIVGHRYGDLIPDIGLSFSQAEYEEGYRLGKPCLVYMRDENVPVLPKHVERDPVKIQKLDQWKSILRERHTISLFREGHDLALRLTADLGRVIKETEGSPQIDLAESKKAFDILSLEKPEFIDVCRQYLELARKNGYILVKIEASINYEAATRLNKVGALRVFEDTATRSSTSRHRSWERYEISSLGIEVLEILRSK